MKTDDEIDSAVSDACREIRNTLLLMDERLRAYGIEVAITVTRHEGNDWAVFAVTDEPGVTFQ